VHIYKTLASCILSATADYIIVYQAIEVARAIRVSPLKEMLLSLQVNQLHRFGSA